MIDRDHYIRLVLLMSQDLKYLHNNLHQFEKVLRNNFGDITYKEVDYKFNRLISNMDVLKEDLKKEGLL